MGLDQEEKQFINDLQKAEVVARKAGEEVEPVLPAGGDVEMTVGDKRNPFRNPAIADGYASGWNVRNREVTRLTAENVRLQALSVTNIMLDVVPGEDGMGEEVYAKSVNDVVGALSKQGDSIEDLEVERDALQSELTEARELLGAVWEFSDRLPDDVRDFIHTFLARQSAPAAKEGSDE